MRLAEYCAVLCVAAVSAYMCGLDVTRTQGLIGVAIATAWTITILLTAGGPAATRPTPSAPEAVSGAAHASLQAMPPPTSPLPPGS